MTIEVVTWRDAYFEQDKEKKRDDYLCKTVGWTKNGPRFLTIRSEKTPDGPRAITYVPNEGIISRVTLVEKS